MKRKKMLSLFIFLMPFVCLSQNIILQNIDVPGQISTGIINGVILGENLIGPRKVSFSGDQMILQKEEIKNNSFSKNGLSVDILPTFYSGKIFSPGIIEPIFFENKIPEELILFEVTVFPKILEQPYTLYIDLIIRTSSAPISSEKSDDAGDYTARISINLTEI
jgi:hypothetical protein